MPLMHGTRARRPLAPLLFGFTLALAVHATLWWAFGARDSTIPQASTAGGGVVAPVYLHMNPSRSGADTPTALASSVTLKTLPAAGTPVSPPTAPFLPADPAGPASPASSGVDLAVVDFHDAKALSVRPYPLVEIRLPEPVFSDQRAVLKARVQLFIDQRGRVLRAEIEPSRLPDNLAAATRKILEATPFHPGQRDGLNVPARTTIEVVFDKTPATAPAGLANADRFPTLPAPANAP